MAKILICVDESRLRSIIKRYAKFEGHDVAEAYNDVEAVKICKQKQPDIIIIDVLILQQDGFSDVKEIRKTNDIPVLILLAHGTEDDKICGFEPGIDSYIVKPYTAKEIMLRVNAILKRTTKVTDLDELDTHEVFRKDDFEADMTAYKVFINGVQANMGPKEYDLLFFLIRNKNVAVSREKLINEVWGYDYYGSSRNLDTHMKLLRKSIGPYAGLITTLRGFGYRFED